MGLIARGLQWLRSLGGPALGATATGKVAGLAFWGIFFGIAKFSLALLLWALIKLALVMLVLWFFVSWSVSVIIEQRWAEAIIYEGTVLLVDMAERFVAETGANAPSAASFYSLSSGLVGVLNVLHVFDIAFMTLVWAVLYFTIVLLKNFIPFFR